MNVLELTRKLIDIPSVTGDEAAVADFLARTLSEQGFVVTRQTVENGRDNLVAQAGPSPKVILCTHMDTVPPFLPSRDDQDFIYGRGACDAKGIMAAMIAAAQSLKESGVQDVALLLVIAEETSSIGAQKANELNLNSKFIIVGEPTDNRLAHGHKGLVALRLSASGKAAHSAFPEQGVSAIDALLDAIQQVRAIDFGASELGPATLNIGQISGGVAHNVIAESASAVISIRSGLTSETIIEQVRNATDPAITIEIITRSEPQTTLTFDDMESVIMPFGTDIPHLTNFGEPLLIGPGSALDAHTEGEKIEKKQLLEAVEMYKELVQRLRQKTDFR